MTKQNIKTQLNTQATPELEQTIGQDLQIPDPSVEVFVGIHASGTSLWEGDRPSGSS